MHNIKPYRRATDEQKANYKPSYTCVEKINFSSSEGITKNDLACQSNICYLYPNRLLQVHTNVKTVLQI